MAATARGAEDDAGDAQDDPIDQEHEEDPGASSQMKARGSQLSSSRAKVVDVVHHPASHGDPANDRDDRNQSLEDHLSKPARALERPREAVGDATHRRGV